MDMKMVPGMRVLVVEDEVKMTALLRRGLDEHGLAPEVIVLTDVDGELARASPA
jgi:DNA-binding response OmpR family regulator